MLYFWGIISAVLTDNFYWTATQTQIPNMVASAVFAFTMILGGRLQDKLGQRLVQVKSSNLAGEGFILSGLNKTVAGLTLFF